MNRTIVVVDGSTQAYAYAHSSRAMQQEPCMQHLRHISGVHKSHDGRGVDIELRGDVIRKAIWHRQLQGSSIQGSAPRHDVKR